ncbi:hypothetical protein M5J14_17395 [Lysinibacillus sp. OL1_EC]|uniref:hypothetical protein n=1 Tax=unclassified Lysinibacillus TaxID=2636778 RepID=UPI0010403B71|nr:MULTISPECIES: hypothetical protein [unclassified Lysinibacillus]MCM0626272.1 hypothetical protein [Lysinibacillus sp. OL1_EC]MCS5502164.1 hypothetical protein [Lysinibacillus sp. A4]TBV86037.1 hypothetical protein EW028_18510 [Lysinibacillus sp. OL1]UKJ46397.1 hypothetical protein L6W14_04960 [Lysinibacillus sp. ACHW1.5]WGT38789.1 hypothetical protein QH639_23760 [Lysinibacillus sp. 1 U-2021]
MFGSIFYNLWGALIAFSIYFFSTFQKPFTPLRILIGSFIVAIIAFFVMFIVRFLIAYILFTPEEDEEAVEGDIEEKELESIEGVKQEVPIANSTVEFQDENSEEIAQVVRTMMSREEDQQVNA